MHIDIYHDEKTKEVQKKINEHTKEAEEEDALVIMRIGMHSWKTKIDLVKTTLLKLNYLVAHIFHNANTCEMQSQVKKEIYERFYVKFQAKKINK